LAVVSANLRNVDSAFEWLERGYAEKDPMFAFLRLDTLFDVLRSDPRFQEPIGRMKFPS